MFDLADPVVEIGNLTRTRSRKSVNLGVSLSDRGSPWAHVRVTIDGPGVSAFIVYGILDDAYATTYGTPSCSYPNHLFQLPRAVYPRGRYHVTWVAEDVAGNKAESEVPVVLTLK